MGLGWSPEPGLTITFVQALLFCGVFFLVLPAINQLLIKKDKDGFVLHLIAVAGGSLMALAWPPTPFAPLIFVAIIPLLYIEHLVSNPQSKYFGRNYFRYVYSGLVAWNILATYWVANSTLPGAVVAFTLNSLVMAIPWVLFHKTKRVLGAYLGYLSLVMYVLTFEYLHMRWDLTWPWLTLGNVFAKYHSLIQWYEYTGHLGGSFWVLAVNVLFFSGVVSIPYLKNFFSTKRNWSAARVRNTSYAVAFIRPVLLLAIPMLVSYWMYSTYKEQGTPVNVTVLQPNIDPYNEKFSGTSREQIAKFTALSAQKITDSTDYLVWPETSIPSYIWIDRPDSSRIFRQVVDFVKEHPHVTLVTGVSALEKYDLPETATARYFRDGACCYDVYNAATQIDTSGKYPVYRKSKLVPGVEQTPYPAVFKVLAEYAIDLGGITGSLGTQETRDVFFNRDGIGVAPVICYESVFGDYMTEYFRNGAQLIFIVTNDGWWQNSAGHVQHLHYASLRAIEARRDIARSANTGVSCFVNQRGDIRQATTYWEDDVIASTLYANKELTFFSRHGDYVGRVAGFLSIFFVLYALVKSRTKKTIG